jgi:hypothetical protein
MATNTGGGFIGDVIGGVSGGGFGSRKKTPAKTLRPRLYQNATMKGAPVRKLPERSIVIENQRWILMRIYTSLCKVELLASKAISTDTKLGDIKTKVFVLGSFGTCEQYYETHLMLNWPAPTIKQAVDKMT